MGIQYTPIQITVELLSNSCKHPKLGAGSESKFIPRPAALAAAGGRWTREISREFSWWPRPTSSVACDRFAWRARASPHTASCLGKRCAMSMNKPEPILEAPTLGTWELRIHFRQNVSELVPMDAFVETHVAPRGRGVRVGRDVNGGTVPHCSTREGGNEIIPHVRPARSGACLPSTKDMLSFLAWEALLTIPRKYPFVALIFGWRIGPITCARTPRWVGACPPSWGPSEPRWGRWRRIGSAWVRASWPRIRCTSSPAPSWQRRTWERVRDAFERCTRGVDGPRTNCRVPAAPRDQTSGFRFWVSVLVRTYEFGVITCGCVNISARECIARIHEWSERARHDCDTVNSTNLVSGTWQTWTRLGQTSLQCLWPQRLPGSVMCLQAKNTFVTPMCGLVKKRVGVKNTSWQGSARTIRHLE